MTEAESLLSLIADLNSQIRSLLDENADLNSQIGTLVKAHNETLAEPRMRATMD